jgi:hypothetical protein
MDLYQDLFFRILLPDGSPLRLEYINSDTVLVLPDNGANTSGTGNIYFSTIVSNGVSAVFSFTPRTV